MPLIHQTQNNIDIIRFEGKMVMANAAHYRQEVLEIVNAGEARLVLDLEKVDFMDSSGLSVLVSALKAARARPDKEGEVALLKLTDTVRALIELTRLQQIFPIFTDEAQALKHLSA